MAKRKTNSKAKGRGETGAEKPPRAGSLDRLEVNRLEARQILGGMAERTFAGLVSNKTIPVVSHGRGGRLSVYDVRTMVPAYLSYLSKQQHAPKERDARARRDESQAQLNELKLQRERGVLVPLADVITEGQNYTKAWTAKVRSIPRRLVQAGALAREHEATAIEIVREIQVEIGSWKTSADTQAAIASESVGAPPA